MLLKTGIEEREECVVCPMADKRPELQRPELTWLVASFVMVPAMIVEVMSVMMLLVNVVVSVCLPSKQITGT